jgi:hypothetical protein
MKVQTKILMEMSLKEAAVLQRFLANVSDEILETCNITETGDQNIIYDIYNELEKHA